MVFLCLCCSRNDILFSGVFIVLHSCVFCCYFLYLVNYLTHTVFFLQFLCLCSSLSYFFVFKIILFCFLPYPTFSFSFLFWQLLYCYYFNLCHLPSQTILILVLLLLVNTFLSLCLPNISVFSSLTKLCNWDIF